MTLYSSFIALQQAPCIPLVSLSFSNSVHAQELKEGLRELDYRGHIKPSDAAKYFQVTL